MKFDLARIIKKEEGLEELTTPFTHDEIDNVIKEMPPDRAPGPDGFTGIFLKTCWEVIKEDFYKLCSELQVHRLKEYVRWCVVDACPDRHVGHLDVVGAHAPVHRRHQEGVPLVSPGAVGEDESEVAFALAREEEVVVL